MYVPPGADANPFRSFWMAGFESATHINKHNVRLDMVASNRHDEMALADYRQLAEFGIRVVRDGLRWHRIDQRGKLDFSSWDNQLNAALSTGTQAIWTLCHYGYPDDLDIFSEAFVDRFRDFCRAAAHYLRERSDEVPFYTPVNEISLYAWAGCRFMYPFAEGRDVELKLQLCRASIAGCEAILEVDQRARFVHAEPLIQVLPKSGDIASADEAAGYNESQYEATDIIGGLQRADLGGQDRYLDMVGLNFYHSNQWEHMGERLRWEDEVRDVRWKPLQDLLAGVAERYGHPILVAETSHFGAGRPRWIREIGEEIASGLRRGTPILGVCLYPILDRYDWENADHWHNSGLWDIRYHDASYDRVINQEYTEALRLAQTSVLNAKI